jgi:general L-amino acid transport system permease protein
MALNDTAPQPFGVGQPARISAFYNPKVRSIVFQAALVIALILIVAWFVNNTIENLRTRNITSGFGFLWNRAGFAIGDTWLTFTADSSNARAFIVGLINTLRVAVIGIFFATILGFLVGIMRLSSNWLVAKVGTVYVETIRNVPVLLWLLFLYKAVLSVLPLPRNAIALPFGATLSNRGLLLPNVSTASGGWAFQLSILIAIAVAIGVARWATQRRMATGQGFPTLRVNLAILIGLPLVTYVVSGTTIAVEYPALQGFNFVGGLQIRPEFLALLVGLTIYTAAFIAEIVRAGILAVSHGQTEAALSLGLRRGRVLRLVVIPQALRVIIPPLTSQYLNLTKNSSLAIAVGYPDLFAIFSKSVLNITGQAIECIAMIMGVYLTLSLLTSAFMNWFNNKMALVER